MTVVIVTIVWLLVGIGILKLRLDIAKEAPTDSPRLYVIIVKAFAWPVMFILGVIGLLIVGVTKW